MNNMMSKLTVIIVLIFLFPFTAFSQDLQNALFDAAYRGDADTVRTLLDRGADPNAKARRGNLPLLTTTRQGYFEIVKTLLDRGADVNARNSSNFTALINAAIGGHFDIVELLLSRGAEVNVRVGVSGETALMWASKGKHTDIVKALLDKGAEVNARTRGGQTALYYAAASGAHETMLLLLDNGAFINVETRRGDTPLEVAARSGHIEIVKFLIDRGVDVNAKSESGWTALMGAALYDHTATARFLIQKGADVNVQGRYGKTPLLLAAAAGHAGTTELLLANGADMNARDKDDKTALMLAARNGQIATTKLLLANGADMNARDKDDRTALMLATEAGHTVIIQLFKEADAKVLALMQAAAEGDTGGVIALLEKGLHVNVKNKGGRTALMLAAEGGHIETVRVLLEKGADVNPTDEKYGFSALEFALGKSHTEIAALLKEAGAGQPKENEFPKRRAGAETETRVGEAMEALEVGKAESIQKRDIGAKNENMVLIPAGEFLMGSPPGEGSASERPQHKVHVDSFYMDKYEVINSRFKEFVDATGYVTDAERRGWSFVAVKDSPTNKVADANWRKPRGPGSDILAIMDHPVVQVTWNDATAYAAWAGKRLPTEAEWEKAARSVDSRKYPWGNNKPDGTQCNFADSHTFFPWSDESCNDGYKYTSPVGSFKSGGSPYGVHDMAGNVWEWCADRFDGDYYESSPKENPQGPSTGSTRVFRGGSWFNDARMARTASRYSREPIDAYDMIGFRCARDAE